MKKLLVSIAALVSIPAFAEEPTPLSGLKVGQRPMPYAFVLATGPNRGTSFCYICDTADKPAAIIFARSLTDPLGKLAAKLDRAVTDGIAPDFRAWMTLLSVGPQPATEENLANWGRKHGIRQMPLGVFDDDTGPPAYRLNRQVDVTVILFVKQKAVATFAFKTGELNDERIAGVVTALAKLKMQDVK